MKKQQFTTDEFGRTVEEGYRGIKATNLPKFFCHTSHHNKFFQDYSVAEVPKRTGKGTTAVRVYVGTLFHQELTKKQSLFVRFAYLAAYAAAVILFILAMTIATASNSCWYVMLALLLPMFFYARFLLALYLYIFSGQDLKIHEYQNGACKLSALSHYIDRTFLVSMLASAVMYVLAPGSYSESELYRFFLFIASALIIKFIGKVEGKIEYTEIPSDEAEDPCEVEQKTMEVFYEHNVGCQRTSR